ncbi:uroporphyrinogen-III synthase [uncultured Friedmanniella sp.]|uniref:uroporphyrinogen-III synthase n=1 Tax=uncultured Friedmanniella sp. TaxID=335381 RepID=UPI0035CB42B6
MTSGSGAGGTGGARTAAGRAEELQGFRIGLTSDRRSTDLISALERRGAQVLHAPALRIAPLDADGTLVRQTQELIATRPEVVLVTTGYGMRRWFEVADAAGLGAELTAVLEQASILARGPKAVGAVRAAGLEETAGAELDTTASLVDAVTGRGLTGRRVAIQLHGFTDEVQLARLNEVSASVLTVTPYRWVAPTSGERLLRLVEAATRQQLDAVVFTSAPGAVATLEAAAASGLGPAFVSALTSGVTAAAVGPVTAEPLRAAGIEVVVPERHRLGALIRVVCEQLSTHHVQRFDSGGLRLELRGRNVCVDGRSITLGPNALAILRTLAATPSVVSRLELSEALPEPLDDHALEVAISRLRRSIGIPDLITTVVRRGYRLNAERPAGASCPAS